MTTDGASMIQPTCFCGASGAWPRPLSRAGFLKQFLCFAGNESLFQQAAHRLRARETAAEKLLSSLIGTRGVDRFLGTKQLRESGIPLGETHRLAKLGTIPLEIIEVQSGSYLGEDDIVRLEDRDGRC